MHAFSGLPLCRCMLQVPPKPWYLSNRLHGAISQNTGLLSISCVLRIVGGSGGGGTATEECRGSLTRLISGIKLLRQWLRNCVPRTHVARGLLELELRLKCP